jgi:hypothetical protein
MAKQGRGILYIVWGERADQVLQRSIDSVKAVHPELPIEVARIPGADAGPKNLLHKAEMMERSPFAETLFLDADTVVLDRLDFGFAKAQRFDAACCVCEAPWARCYKGLADRGDMIDYNTGVLFFTEGARPLFTLWQRLAQEIDSGLVYAKDGKVMIFPFADQASFAAAVDQAGTPPFVLPLNWNYRPEFQKSFFGPIKVWHSYLDVPPEFHQLAAYYRNPESVVQYVEMR